MDNKFENTPIIIGYRDEQNANGSTAYKIHCFDNGDLNEQLHEFSIESMDDAIDFACSNRNNYDNIKVFSPVENNIYNCNLNFLNGHPALGSPDFFDLAVIRMQELDWWPEVATNSEYKRVTPEQISNYYSEHVHEIMTSLWPAIPDQSEVIAYVAHKNNENLFDTECQPCSDNSPKLEM